MAHTLRPRCLLRPALLPVLVALPALLAAQAPPPLGPTVIGKLVWPGHDLSRGQVRVYADGGLRELVDQFGTGGEKGTFCLIVDPGEYYLMAVVDVNGNEKVDEGDGLGFFGVTQFGAEGQKPKAVQVAAETVVGDVVIPITATLDAQGKPVPIPGLEAEPLPEPSDQPASIAGKLTGIDGPEVPVFVLLLKASNYGPVDVVEVSAEEAGFAFAAAPAEYRLVAVADLSGDGKLGPGDAFGAYGVTDWAAAPQELPTLVLASGAQVGGTEVALTGRLGEGGLVNPPAGTGSLRVDVTALPAIIAGTVPYPAAGLKPTHVRLAADVGMAQPIAVTECKPGPASFVFAVPSGTYYVTAVVDENGDGRFGPGDAVGFLGVTDLSSGAAPPPTTVGPGSIVTGLKVPITLRIDEQGKPVPLPTESVR